MFTSNSNVLDTLDYVYTKMFSPVNALFLMRLHFPFTRKQRKRKPETHRNESVCKGGYPG